MDKKKLLLKDLSVKDQKAKADRARGSPSSADTIMPALIPEITELIMPLSVRELEVVRSFAEQLNNLESFKPESTWVRTGKAALRVSPLRGISLAEYIMSARALEKHLAFKSTYLVNACVLLEKDRRCMIPLKELWRNAGAPMTKVTSAQKMIDMLMRAPLVAVRVGVGDSFDSSWVMLAKEGGVNYTQLASIMAVIEKPSSSRIISQERLRALTRQASTNAERRLIELAALDQLSSRTQRELTGRWHDSMADRKKRERAMAEALETMNAYQELAAMDTLAEINALVGEDISDAELKLEVEKLKAIEADLEARMHVSPAGEDDDGALTDSTHQLLTDARYDTEDFEVEHQLHANFLEVLDEATEEETHELMSRLQAAGCPIGLDMESLKNCAKQQQLKDLFGVDWEEAICSCLCEPLVPGRDSADEHELVDDLDYFEGEFYQNHLMDHIEEIAMDVKRTEQGTILRSDEGDDEDEGITSTSAREALLLAEMTPRQLITKLMARNRRKRMRQASQSDSVHHARGILNGERGRSACLDTVLRKWPDVGDKIEAICEDLQVGADAKRRDGAITLNSAVNRGKGGTGFVRIRLELQKRYGIELSARALRDLCHARDRRMRCAARYKNVVNLKYRRSVKRIGQENLDDHAQNAMYKVLHYIRDRTSFDSTLWFQRDDHSKVRGGSSESTRQHATVTCTGAGASALQKDYMDTELLSTIYASSLLVSGCADGGAERCLAFVKAEKLAPSSPTQHYADFYSLQQQAREDSELRPIFFTAAGQVKPKVQLEVDGGHDENPTGRETRFLQTELLMGGPFLENDQRRAQVGTSTREAGGSPMNKVERLNGEMTRAAAGFHALGTVDVVGDLRDDSTGQYDRSQLEALWKKHAEDYRVLLDGNCGLNGGTLAAFAGAEAASCPEAKELLARRPQLLLLLDPTTSRKKLAELQKSYPVLTAHFKKVATLQEHVELVTHYSSCVRCCASTACQLCSGAPRVVSWYEGGPLLKPVPPALQDPDRPGHYLGPKEALQQYAVLRYKLNAEQCKSPADRALGIYEQEMGPSLLPFPEVKLSSAVQKINDYRVTVDVLTKHFTKLRYIRLRRLEGARKAAATRKRNQQERMSAAAARSPVLAATHAMQNDNTGAAGPGVAPPPPPADANRNGSKRKRAQKPSDRSDDDAEEDGQVIEEESNSDGSEHAERHDASCGSSAEADGTRHTQVDNRLC